MHTRPGLRAPLSAAGLLAGIAAIAIAVGYPSWEAPSASMAAPPAGALREEHPAGGARGIGRPGALPPRIDPRATPARSDGALPAGTTVFDGEAPGVANLDPSLRDALREAAEDAAEDGVELQVNSGWRSPEYQAQLLRDAISRYGSEREATRWVATPATSAHVSGDAVDAGFAATAWLAEHGAAYGLCQVYRNELWHFELRPDARRRGCPPLYPDPSHDPRMHR